MSDHKFEEQVQKKMEELRLTPSASVWQGVEKELQGSPRRRRFVWIPLLVLFTGLGGFLLFKSVIIPAFQTSPSTELSQKETKKSLHEPNSDQKTNANKAGDNTHQVLPSTPADGQTVSVDPHQKEPLNQQTGIPSGDLAGLSSTDNRKNNSSDRNVENNVAGNARSKSSIPAETRSGKEIAGREGVVPENDVRVNEINAAEEEYPVAVIRSAGGNAQDVTLPGYLLYKPIPLPAPIAKADQAAGQKSASKHFKFGMEAYTGVSGINNGGFLSGIFGVNKSAVSDVAANSSMSTFFQGNAIRYKPSIIKPGFAFAIGGFIQKDIGKRTALSTGLSYAQYTTQITVGEHVQSNAVVNNYRQGYTLVANYYRPEQTSEFTNRYHFIQLPVQFLWTLNNSQKLPLIWNLGMSYTRLIASDALQFDGTTGIYYKNNTLLNRNLLELSSGFSLGLRSSSRLPVSVGPSIRYQLSGQMKKGGNDGRHFLSLGIDFKFLLKR